MSAIRRGGFNDANEQTARDSATPVYDAVGNLTDDDEEQEYVYDAFGRLVRIDNQSSLTISQHRYNGLGYRIAWQYDLDADGGIEPSGSNDDPWLYLVYDTSWRVVATAFAVDNGAGKESGEYLAKADDDPRELFVFHTAGTAGRGGSSKLDETILRDRDFNQTWGAAGDGTAEQRTYYAQNWRGDVVATLDSTGARRETVRYSTYGVPFGIPCGDVNGGGTVGAADRNAINAQIGKTYGVAGYTVLLDVDLDGDIDINDWNIANNQAGVNLGHALLSSPVGYVHGGNRIGYAGYAWEAPTSKYHVRHRLFDSVRGRWSRRDPLGYVDSPTMYAYVDNRAMTEVDPTGMSVGRPQSPRGPEPVGNIPPPEGQLACAPFAEGDGSAPGCSIVAGGGAPSTGPSPAKIISDCAHDYGNCVAGAQTPGALANCMLTLRSCLEQIIPGPRPLPSNSNECSEYAPNDTYKGANAACFCQCAGDSSWSQTVRGCLRDLYEQGIDPDSAHIACYLYADSFGFERPWATLAWCAVICSTI